MATINFINSPKGQSRAGMNAVLDYTMRPDKTQGEHCFLISGQNCSPETAYEEFINTKLMYGKDSGRRYYHFVQSFSPEEEITPELAHQVALETAAYYPDFEVLICTHTEREHIHSHFIINAVSFETGKKLHQDVNAIEQLRTFSDGICNKYNLSICPKNEDTIRVKPMSAGEYHQAKKGNSWKMRLINEIDDTMHHAKSKADFIHRMGAKGYGVKWEPHHKYITYQTPTGKRCRDNKLHETRYLKENMEAEFAIRTDVTGGTKSQKQTKRTPLSDRFAAATQPNATAPNAEYRHGNAVDSTACAARYPHAHLGAVARGAVPLRPDGTDVHEPLRDVDGANRDADAASGTQQRELSQPEWHTQQPECITGTPTQQGESGSDSGAMRDATPANDRAEPDVCTGWETERMAFLQENLADATVGRMLVDAVDSTNVYQLGGDLLRLGRDMEQLERPVPVIDSTTRKTPERDKNKPKKRGIGQKEDDHQDPENEVGMSMSW
ncbi:MAG: relaxase/mobilization nuclease domain-containing protein [Faecalibacterium sp.]